MGTFFAAAITALLTITIVDYGFSDGRLQQSLHIVSQIRPKVVLSNVIVMTVVITTGYYLDQLPVLNWGWWDLLRSEASNEENISNESLIWIGLRYEYFALIFVGLLAIAIPQVAHEEEKWFREGTLDWRNAIPRSFLFGILHCIAGISLAFGLALGIAGMWFTHHYFKGGVERATLYHATWNLIIIVPIFFLVLFGLY